MDKEKYYKVLFIIAGIYDVILGFGFCFFYKWLFQTILHRPIPQPPIYFQVCAAFIGLIGIGYFLVWKNLYRNVDLVIIGGGMKVIYIKEFHNIARTMEYLLLTIQIRVSLGA